MIFLLFIILCINGLNIDKRIIGGQVATKSDWWFIVRFKYIHCVATVITPRWIVTAAHCTQDTQGTSYSLTELAFIVGDYDKSTTTDGDTTFQVSM